MTKNDLEFNGLGTHLGNIARLSNALSRSISAENFTGEKGKGGMAVEGTGASVARDLGQGWKISPSINLPAGAVITLADIAGPGAVRHIWCTVFPAYWRSIVLRCYWDGEESPSIETPLGDFFCNGWCQRSNVSSLPVAVNPAGGFNSYWEMPFHHHARITIENLLPVEIKGFYYQVDYSLTDIPADYATLHAQWRRSNPLPRKQVHTLLDGVCGQGHYVGTYIAWGVHNTGWWGEGEIKFYLDGDHDRNTPGVLPGGHRDGVARSWPTICGTGTEDYFGGAWNFEHPKGEYGVYSTPFLGLPQVIIPDGLYKSQQRFGMYRWHIPDPIRFQQDLHVTIQALGWSHTPNGEARYLPLQDDIASTAFWYQSEPHVPFGKTFTQEELEVV